MKKLIIVFLVTVFTTLSTFSNNEKPVKKADLELRNKIVKLLGDYESFLEKNTETKVSFLINNKGEIVVLSVDSKEQVIENYVKTKLNYKKTALKNVARMKKFVLSIKFIKKIN
ncbi:hypothetical protein MC378_08570 [Polaribacter sp. MSW13]|uniref:Uncharacterized protein n=1 Tax=Polaribacter marinus TaxID=2916838 RepID=A0A9X1VNA9_9FLAO|nr:hypothetical protein [Polaribacter marinus]MCI2229218.1 hypothetical protein [Polaribacter marinus]